MTFDKCKTTVQTLLTEGTGKSLTSSDERIGFLLANLDEESLKETLDEGKYPSAYAVAFKKGIITDLDFEKWMTIQNDHDRFEPRVMSIQPPITQRGVSEDRDKPTDGANSDVSGLADMDQISLTDGQKETLQTFIDTLTKVTTTVSKRKFIENQMVNVLKENKVCLNHLDDTKLTIKKCESNAKKAIKLEKSNFLVTYNPSDNTENVLFDIRQNTDMKPTPVTFSQKNNTLLCFTVKQTCFFGRNVSGRTKKYTGTMYYFLFRKNKRKKKIV